jgi:hypothetical protein
MPAVARRLTGRRGTVKEFRDDVKARIKKSVKDGYSVQRKSYDLKALYPKMTCLPAGEPACGKSTGKKAANQWWILTTWRFCWKCP